MDYELYDDLHIEEMLKKPKRIRQWWHYSLFTFAIGAPICVVIMWVVYR